MLGDLHAVSLQSSKTYVPKNGRLYRGIEAASHPALPNILSSSDAGAPGSDGRYWAAVRAAWMKCFTSPNLKRVSQGSEVFVHRHCLWCYPVVVSPCCMSCFVRMVPRFTCTFPSLSFALALSNYRTNMCWFQLECRATAVWCHSMHEHQ